MTHINTGKLPHADKNYGSYEEAERDLGDTFGYYEYSYSYDDYDYYECRYYRSIIMIRKEPN